MTVGVEESLFVLFAELYAALEHFRPDSRQSLSFAFVFGFVDGFLSGGSADFCFCLEHFPESFDGYGDCDCKCPVELSYSDAVEADCPVVCFRVYP